MVYSELYSTVLGAFQSAGWNYSEVEGREVIRAGFEGHHTRVELHVQCFEPLAAVSVVAEAAQLMPDPLKRDRLAELIMRVNQTLTIGNFEIEWDTGRLFFRTTNLFPTPQGDGNIVQGMVHNTVGEMDRIAPFLAIIQNASGPELAALDFPALLQREDLLPEVPVPDQKSNANSPK
ncbi:MAG: hypothetical protein P1U87_14145 [Verrucomicrobiales bacterium]|nr:hypothetical protein [Verrucomicrobiales bacterium]